jgi:raffinose synthase
MKNNIVFKLLLFSFISQAIAAGGTGKQRKQANADNPQVLYNGHPAGGMFSVERKTLNGVAIYYVKLARPQFIKAEDTVGVYFREPVGMTGGVALWDYRWGIWSKPVALQSSAGLPTDRVQFFYWKCSNGSYGAAVPLSGNGYRTVLGSQGNLWGSKAMGLLARHTGSEIPAMAIAYDKDPYKLFKKIYTSALIAMHRGNDMRWKKTFPGPFKYIGWCTWNSSNQGKDLSEDEIIAGVKTFTGHNFQLGWVLIDDGWFRLHDSRLQSLLPDPKKFPDGFAGMNKRLKSEFGIKYVGIWHAFDGYWIGIDSNSELGKRYKNDLFGWGNDKNPAYFIKPGPSLTDFYDSWYKYFKQQGFDFTKVDNQVSNSSMALNNYPVFSLSASIHKALYKASDKYFHGAMINCMDMVPDAYFNFGSSAVSRSGEDYFPYQKDEGYNLEQGNAAAHVVQAIYNSIYFSQMIYPDFDMFETSNPNAVLHAVARAVNCGPVYITDKPGQQNFSILNSLTYHDGRTVHSDHPLLPSADCLLQVQDKKLFKAFSMAGNAGLLDVFNATDTDKVSGTVSPDDVNGIAGGKFVVYEHFSGECLVMQKHQKYKVSLPRLGYKLYYIVPLKNGFAPLGLTEKYAAPATILSSRSSLKSSSVTLYEGGLFKAYCEKEPASAWVNGKRFTQYDYQNGIMTINVPFDGDNHPQIKFVWN